jgi:hypothetical protein
MNTSLKLKSVDVIPGKGIIQQTQNTYKYYKKYYISTLFLNVTVYQYSETNVMHFLFNLLRIKSRYMFRALLAHPQEALVILRACYVSWLHQATNTHAACVVPPEDEQVTLETCRGP